MEKAKNEWLKPLISAIVGSAFSGVLLVMQVHTDVEILKARVQEKERVLLVLVEEVKEMRAEIYYMSGRSAKTKQ